MEREWDPDADANAEKEEGRENNDLLEGAFLTQIYEGMTFFTARLFSFCGIRVI